MTSTAPEGFYWSPCRPSLARAGRFLCVLMWIGAIQMMLNNRPGGHLLNWQLLIGPLFLTLQVFQKPTLHRVSTLDRFGVPLVIGAVLIGAAFLLYSVRNS